VLAEPIRAPPINSTNWQRKHYFTYGFDFTPQALLRQNRDGRASFLSRGAAPITFWPSAHAMRPPASIAMLVRGQLALAQGVHPSDQSIRAHMARAQRWSLRPRHYLQHQTRPLLAILRRPRRNRALRAQMSRRGLAIRIFCPDALFRPTNNVLKSDARRFSRKCSDLSRIPHY
jgi:hypothetical protein